MEPLVSLLVAALLLVVPGALVLAVVGPRPLPSPWLALPLASVLSLGLLTAALGATMLLQASAVTTYVLLAAISVALLVLLLVRRRRHRPAPPWHRLDAPGTVVALAALAAAVLGYVVQGSLQSDTLYHVAQGLKIADLPNVGLSNTLQFVDGSTHPGYLVPTFQAFIGLASKGRDALELTLLLPVLTAPLGVLAAAALGHVAAGTRRAGAIAALAFLAWPVLGTAPRFVPLAQSSYAGVFVLTVVTPCVVALVVAAMLPERAAPRPRLLLAAAIGTLLVGVLHASYLSLLAMPMLGLALGWSWSRPHAPGEVRRVAVALGTVFAAACTITLALAPFLARLRSFTQTGSADAIKGLEAGVDRPDAADAARLFVGGGKHFHLRADALVADGGVVLALLVLLVVCGVVLRRTPLGWLALGCTALVLAVSQVGFAFGTLAAVMGADQARRIGEALPLVLGFVAAGEVLAGLARRPRRTTLARWLSAGTALAVVIAALAVPVLAARGDDPVFPQWPVIALAAVSVLAVIVLLARPSAPAWPALRGLESDHLALAALPTVAAVAVALVLAWGDLGDRLDLHGEGTSRAELVSFSDADVRAIRSLPTGAVVLADVRHRTSFRVMSYAPVYVIGAPPGHVANTRRNDIRGRLARTERLLQPNRTPDERRADLDRFHVDAVVLRDLPRYEPVAQQLRGALADDWRELRHDGDYAVFVRRSPRAGS